PNSFTDIQYFISHIPLPPNACVILPPVIAFSGSKICLGGFSVKRNGKPSGLWGPDLNCWSGGWPMPSSVLIPTRMPTVFVGFSWLDLLKSVLFCLVEAILSKLLDKLFDKFKDSIKNFIAGKLTGTMAKYLEQIIFKQAAVMEFLEKLPGFPKDLVAKLTEGALKTIAGDEMAKALAKGAAATGTELAKKLYSKA